MTSDLKRKLQTSLGGVEVPHPNLHRVRKRAAGLRARRMVGAGLAAALVAAGVVLPLVLLARFGEAPPAPASQSVEGFGLRMSVPQGWDGRLYWTSADLGPVVQAATFPLPAPGPDFNRESVVHIAADDALLTLHEFVGVCPCSGFTTIQQPPGLAGLEHRELPWLEEGHAFFQGAIRLSDRWFIATVEFGSDPPPEEARRATNEALGSLAVDPGEPRATLAEPGGGVNVAPWFERSPGWTVISKPGRAEALEPGMAWTASVPLPAQDLAFWAQSDVIGGNPQETLRTLPEDGVVIVAWLPYPGERDQNLEASVPARDLPLQVSDADVRSNWEGQVAENVPEYVLWRRVDGWFVDVRLFFGTQHPSKETLALAQEQLDRLALPEAPWADPGAEGDSWVTANDEEDRYSLEVRANWSFNIDPTPQLAAPPILFAAGTGEVPQSDGCAPHPAIDGLPADGALFWVMEYEGTGTAGFRAAYEFTPRAGPLDLGPLQGPFDCFGEATHLVLWRDGGRFFQAHVMFGPEASDDLRSDVTRSLSSFTPLRGEITPCDRGGPWTACPEASWVFRVVREAGFEHLGDTGSAITARGRAAEFHIWATDADAGPPEVESFEEAIARGVYQPLTMVEGVTVYVEGPGDDGAVERVVWEAQGFLVWVSSARATGDTGVPDEHGLGSLVRASLDVAFVDDP